MSSGVNGGGRTFWALKVISKVLAFTLRRKESHHRDLGRGMI